MSKPTPEDREAFNKWLVENADKPVAKPNELSDADLKNFLSAENLQAGMEQALEHEKFLAENQVQSDFDQATYEEEQKIKGQKYSLTRTLNFLNWAVEEKKINSDTTFESLWKVTTGEARRRFLPENETAGENLKAHDFLNDSETLLHLLKVLIELKEDGINETLEVRQIITLIQEKFDSLKNL